MASDAGRAGMLFLCAVLAATAIGFYSRPVVAIGLGAASFFLGAAFLGGTLKARADRLAAAKRRSAAPVRMLHRGQAARLVVRLRCPKCRTLVVIPGGTRPVCRGCGYMQKTVVL